MSQLTEYFNDPLDPERSLQLNNRYWEADSFKHLEALREADYDVNNARLSSLRKSLKHVKALLPPQVHRTLISRLIYSMVYQVLFEPIRFDLKLSDEFIKANSYSGPDAMSAYPGRLTEELKYIVGLAHDVYRDKYGVDVLTSDFGVRYINASNPNSKPRMTKYGDFSDFHLDEGKDFTCIIYLCPVTTQNGCFTYVDGTNAIKKSHLLRALHQTVDIMGISLATPDKLLELPLELRGSMSLGNYLDEPKREQLRGAVVPVVGGTGHGIMFNGFDTLHRGGQPLGGERTALFISTKGNVRLRVKKAMFDQMAYLWL